MCGAADAAMASLPCLDHLDIYDKDCTKWREAMETPAEDLARALRCTSDWGICKVCDLELPKEIQRHLCGHNHCHKLRARLNYRLPQHSAELEAFVQRWKLDSGPHARYCFNHVTLEQGYEKTGQGQCGAAVAASSRSDSSGIDPLQENDPWARPRPAAAASAAASAAAPGRLPETGLLAMTAERPSSSGTVTPLPGPPQPESFETAMFDKAVWRRWMDGPAQKLEDALFALCGWGGGYCVICSTAMGRGAHDHLRSENHWKLVRKKFGNDVPQAADGIGSNEGCVQRFETDKGDYFFNHLTGEQGHDSGSLGMLDPALAPAIFADAMLDGSQNGDPWEEQQHQPIVDDTGTHPAPIVPLSRASIEGLMDDRGLAQLRSANIKTFSVGECGRLQAVQASASATVVSRDTSVAPLSRINKVGNYERAMGSKQQWRSFMEGPATQLENFLWDHTKVWGGLCVVCGSDMSAGMGEHMPSQHHWKALRKKLGFEVPPLYIACKWDQPWVQRFDTSKGMYVFNHVTGQHGLEAKVSSGPSNGKDDSLAPQQAVCNGGSKTPSESSRQLNGSRPTVEKFDLTSWVWRRNIFTGAQDLQGILREGGDAFVHECKVCEVPLRQPVAEHLMCPRHFRNLSKRLSDASAELVCNRIDNGAWVQKFLLVSGKTVRFNHLTGEVQHDAD